MLAFMNKKTIASILILIVFISALLAYFGRPKPPMLDLVSARQELPEMSEHLPGSTALADRVTNSYSLAMILVKSPYAASNAAALESMRTWAAERFQREPGFLHPISLESEATATKTFFDSLFYNIGSYIYFGLEEGVGNLLQGQIARFHQSKAYNAFRSAYFDLFGMDADSATLLARYQSERAKLAVNVLLWSMLWTIAISAGLTFVVMGVPGRRFDRLRQVLAYEWFLLSGCYMVIAIGENLVSMLVSSLVACCFGLYLKRPLMLDRWDTGAFKLVPIDLTSKVIALALWLTFSLATIQVLTWIRIGTLSDPDPITLLLSSFSGNFIHDPANGKRIIMRAVGVIWIVLGIWTGWQSKRDEAAAREAERALASLMGPYNPYP